jgi:DNA-3-methyladenine glycosylase
MNALDPPLPQSFFARAADDVALDLVGARIIRRTPEGMREWVIEETEAYLGTHDLACHSSRGRTARTAVMFGAPGRLYVYLVYGLHLMLNVVTGPPGAGAAVLLRNAGGIVGPGRLGRALGLTLEMSGKPAEFETGLWFAPRRGAAPRVAIAPRIGVAYAGPEWAARPLRFTRSD